MKLNLGPTILVALLVCPSQLTLEAPPDAEFGIALISPLEKPGREQAQFGPLSEPNGLILGV